MITGLIDLRPFPSYSSEVFFFRSFVRSSYALTVTTAAAPRRPLDFSVSRSLKENGHRLTEIGTR